MTTTRNDLIGLTDLASALIRDEVRVGFRRELLERAVYDSIVKMGANINDVSAATGLRCEEIREILARPRDFSLDELFGMAEGGSAMIPPVESSASS